MSTRSESSSVSFSASFLTVLLLIHVLGYALALPLVSWKWLIFPSAAAISLVVLPRRLPGRRPYVKLWFFGTLFWLYVSHFVRYPHWINYGLWLALGAYLGCYLPLFAATARTLLHQRLPRFFYPLLGRKVFSAAFRTLAFLFVVPTVWAGCDVLRGWVFSGFMMGSVADAFYRDPLWLQTADLVGQWGTSALFVFLSAALGLLLWPILSRFSGKTHAPAFGKAAQTRTLLAALALIFGLAFLLGYGTWRLNQRNPNVPVGHFALLQGNVPAELTTTPELIAKTDASYLKLAEEVRVGKEARAIRKAGGRMDLVIFPECVYRYAILFSVPNAFQPKDLTCQDGSAIDSETFQRWLARASSQSQTDLINFAHYVIQAPFLAGCSTFNYAKDRVEGRNSALFIPEDAQQVSLEDAYHKMILVPFGEYVPLVKPLRKWFPGIDSWMPINSQDAGTRPVAIPVRLSDGETLHASLSICFESVLGRLTRRQIATLRQTGTEPDCIINLTNNGWFRHSHETRLHLACGVFRAIENRKPLLVAANYGISASITSNGQILGELPVGQEGVLFAQIQKDARRTSFTAWGGFFLWLPLLVMLAGCGKFPKRSKKLLKTAE